MLLFVDSFLVCVRMEWWVRRGCWREVHGCKVVQGFYKTFRYVSGSETIVQAFQFVVYKIARSVNSGRAKITQTIKYISDECIVARQLFLHKEWNVGRKSEADSVALLSQKISIWVS